LTPEERSALARRALRARWAIQRTGRILTGVLGGKVVSRDVPGAPAGTYDFDLVLDDGRVVAVEVTTSTDRKVVEFWAAAHAQSWESRQLRNSWLLNVTPPANIKALRGNVEPLLRGLEQAGISKFGLGHRTAAPEVNTLHRLLVKGGDVLQSALPPRIYLYSTGAGAVGIDAVREAVEHEAAKPDNRAKLGRAAADAERHLFVWIDPLHTRAAAAMGFMGITTPTGCTLPPEVDTLWVGTPAVDEAGHEGEHVWRYTRRRGWENVRRR
jgi:hypothetical protein